MVVLPVKSALLPNIRDPNHFIQISSLPMLTTSMSSRYLPLELVSLERSLDSLDSSGYALGQMYTPVACVKYEGLPYRNGYFAHSVSAGEIVLAQLI
jgi:hypothetical protein